MTEIFKYYSSLIQEISARQLANEDGESQEQTFTRYVVDMLADAGETENVDVAYYEKALGTPDQTKLNAYAITDNYESVDLFVSIYEPDEEIRSISKEEITRSKKRLANFFKKFFNSEWVNDLDESAQIFEFAKTLSSYSELRDNLIRVNAFILTNGEYKGDLPESDDIAGYKIYYRVIDINFIYGISKESRIPIEIDFEENHYSVPCLPAHTENDDYQAYVAIIPGSCLADLYERFGARLMEQNVRTFLQFTGKINKGIRETINKEPHMFLAFNNGLAATADDILLDDTNRFIKRMSNLQIVNGGQTTASIYHTKKKDKADVSQIYVQAKISVIKKKEQYAEIVSRISRYANTQNKVNDADFTANNPILIELEKLSRYMLTPVSNGTSMQTYWFFERARGQYKNTRQKDGFTASRQKAFDLKYPKSQVFTKVELAKYVNSWSEVYEKKSSGKTSLVVAPFSVVRGNEKNYACYMKYSLPKDVDNIYFEDVVAKAILFKEADCRYGTKRNDYCIGELKQVVVPYTIGLLNLLTKGNLDLYKIWKNQAISCELSNALYNLMTKVNQFILVKSPISHYIEWAKKEECWQAVKCHEWNFDLNEIKDDLVDPRNPPKRKSTKEDVDMDQRNEESALIKEIHPVLWDKIAEWGKDSGFLEIPLQIAAKDIANRLRYCLPLRREDREKAMRVHAIVGANNPDMLLEAESLKGSDYGRKSYDIGAVKQLLEWNDSRKLLKTTMVNDLKKIALGKLSFDSERQYLFANALLLAKLEGYEF